MNPTAIEAHLKWVLLQWSIIIIVSWAFGRLGRRLGQPLAVGEILAGILLGPSALGLIWPEGVKAIFRPETQQSLQLLGKIGLILLMFQVGMEFDYGHLSSRSKTVLAVSGTGILAPFLLGILAAPWLHREFAPETGVFGFSLFVCIAISITALPIMGRILLEMGLERTALGVVAISSAAIDDVVGWILLAVATALVSSGFLWSRLLLQIAGVVLFFLFLLFVLGPGLRALWRRVGGKSDGSMMPTSFLAILLVALMACCLATNLLGVFSIFGAFLLGIALHQELGLVKAWRNRFADFVLVALVPIFFTNTGLRTEVGSLSGGVAWLGCAVILVISVVGKLGGCWLGGRLTGQPRAEAACVAALMNTRGLMGLVAINIGADLGLLPKRLFTMFVIMALLTTMMTGPLLRIWLPESLRPRSGAGNGGG